MRYCVFPFSVPFEQRFRRFPLALIHLLSVNSYRHMIPGRVYFPGSKKYSFLLIRSPLFFGVKKQDERSSSKGLKGARRVRVQYSRTDLPGTS